MDCFGFCEEFFGVSHYRVGQRRLCFDQVFVFLNEVQVYRVLVFNLVPDFVYVALRSEIFNEFFDQFFVFFT
jgi:hypothetical protein